MGEHVRALPLRRLGRRCWVRRESRRRRAAGAAVPLRQAGVCECHAHPTPTAGWTVEASIDPTAMLRHQAAARCWRAYLRVVHSLVTMIVSHQELSTRTGWSTA